MKPEEPATAAIEKSLEEMKQLLLKVIADQPSAAGKELVAAPATIAEKSLGEIKQLLLKLIADLSSAVKELVAAIAEKTSGGKEPAAADELAKGSKSLTMNLEDEYTMAKCMKMIERMGIHWPSSTGSFYHVSELLQDKGKREMFMSMSNCQRENWIIAAKLQIRN